MNVYDFDGTIYDGDSTKDFYFFALRRHPRIIKFLPRLLFTFLAYALFKKIDKTSFKEKMYKFLTYVDIENDLSDFWEEKKHNIKQWYLEQKRPDDLIISASPFFLLEPACKELGVLPPIASNVHCQTGSYSGLNCHGKEKVVRFFTEHPEKKIEKFYSDSYSDEPLADLAEKAFFVKGNNISDWNFNRKGARNDGKKDT